MGLKVLDQAIDTTTPTGRLMFNMLGAIAQFERELIRERMLVGIAKAKAEGKYKGRAPTARAQAEKVRQLKQAGVGPSEIARQVGISRTSVFRILTAANYRLGRSSLSVGRRVTHFFTTSQDIARGDQSVEAFLRQRCATRPIMIEGGVGSKLAAILAIIMRNLAAPLARDFCLGTLTDREAGENDNGNDQASMDLEWASAYRPTAPSRERTQPVGSEEAKTTFVKDPQGNLPPQALRGS